MDYSVYILLALFFVGFCYLYLVMERSLFNEKMDRTKLSHELTSKMERLAAKQIALTKAKHVHVHLYEVDKVKAAAKGKGLDALVRPRVQ